MSDRVFLTAFILLVLNQCLLAQQCSQEAEMCSMEKPVEQEHEKTKYTKGTSN